MDGEESVVGEDRSDRRGGALDENRRLKIRSGEADEKGDAPRRGLDTAVVHRPGTETLGTELIRRRGPEQIDHVDACRERETVERIESERWIGVPGDVFMIVVLDMPTGELVVKSTMVLPGQPICAMTVSLRKTPDRREERRAREWRRRRDTYRSVYRGTLNERTNNVTGRERGELTEVGSHADDGGRRGARSSWTRPTVEEKLNRNGTHRCRRRRGVEIFDLQGHGVVVGHGQCEDQGAVLLDQRVARGETGRTDRSAFVVTVGSGRGGRPAALERVRGVGVGHLDDVNVLDADLSVDDRQRRGDGRRVQFAIRSNEQVDSAGHLPGGVASDGQSEPGGAVEANGVGLADVQRLLVVAFAGGEVRADAEVRAGNVGADRGEGAARADVTVQRSRSRADDRLRGDARRRAHRRRPERTAPREALPEQNRRRGAGRRRVQRAPTDDPAAEVTPGHLARRQRQQEQRQANDQGRCLASANG